jgi:hypothetical protein
MAPSDASSLSAAASTSNSTSAASTAASVAVSAERLVVQLQTLSQVVEMLTYRLLELEERLAADEQGVLALQQELVGPALSEDAEQRIDDTEKRLASLETLLSGIGLPAGSVRNLDVVRANRRMDTSIDGPFFEDGEQPFLEDMPAHDPFDQGDSEHLSESDLGCSGDDERLIA